MPYVAPIQKVLVTKLRAGGPSSSAATAAAAATTHGPASMAAAPKPKDGGKGGKGAREVSSCHVMGLHVCMFDTGDDHTAATWAAGPHLCFPSVVVRGFKYFSEF